MDGRRKRRAIGLMLCALVLLSAAWAAGGGASPAHARTGDLEWRACQDGFQCATLSVPRDWARPGGPRIRLSLIRLPATRPGKGRVRSLLVNFGGPGASGVGSLRQSGKQIRDATRGRLHVVSWDPRGVGESAPILCPEGN